jgi:hypothetical protein
MDALEPDRGYHRTVREFINEFRGLSRSAKQKLVLDEVGASRVAPGGSHDKQARQPHTGASSCPYWLA